MIDMNMENGVITITNSLNNEYNKVVNMVWNPKKDITTYELALCIPYLNRQRISQYEISESNEFFRHFDIHYNV